MYNKLPGLPSTAGEHRPEDGNIQPTLERSKSHLCIGCQGGLVLGPSCAIAARFGFQARSSLLPLLASNTMSLSLPV